MGGPIRIDWQQIKDRWTLPALKDVHLFAFPKGFAQLVLAIQERLHWEATYRISDYDYSDWDTLQEIVDAGLAGLTDSIMLQDLLTHVDELETLLEAIRDKNECCPDSGWDDVLGDDDGIVTVGDDDQTGQDIVWGQGDPPGDAQDWNAADAERCAAAQKFAAELHKWLTLSQIMQEAGEGITATLFVASIAAFAATGLGIPIAVGAISVGTVYGLMQFLQDAFQVGPDFPSARAELQDPDVQQEITCAIISANTPSAAEVAIDAALAEHAPAAYPIVKGLPLRYFMGHLFSLEIDGSGFGGPCPDCDQPPAAYYRLHEFGTNANGRDGSTGGTLQADWIDYTSGSAALVVPIPNGIVATGQEVEITVVAKTPSAQSSYLKGALNVDGSQANLGSKATTTTMAGYTWVVTIGTVTSQVGPNVRLATGNLGFHVHISSMEITIRNP